MSKLLTTSALVAVLAIGSTAALAASGSASGSSSGYSLGNTPNSNANNVQSSNSNASDTRVSGGIASGTSIGTGISTLNAPTVGVSANVNTSAKTGVSNPAAQSETGLDLTKQTGGKRNDTGRFDDNVNPNATYDPATTAESKTTLPSGETTSAAGTSIGTTVNDLNSQATAAGVNANATVKDVKTGVVIHRGHQ